MTYLCNFFGLNEVADYWEQVVKLNEWQQERIYKIIVEKLFGNLANKKIAILGFAFKANTNDTRESPAISICTNLLSEGSLLKINDPKVNLSSIKNTFKNIEEKFNNYEYISDIYDCIEDADGVVILTEWEEYKNINWAEVAKKMRKPSWVFDTRGIEREKEEITSS